VPTESDDEASMMAKFGIQAAFDVTNKQSLESQGNPDVEVCYKMGGVNSVGGSANCVSQTNPLHITVPSFDVTTVTPVDLTAKTGLTVFPCEEQEVVVNLKSNVRIFKKCAGEDVNIVLGGLTIFQTQDPSITMAYKVPSTGAAMSTPGALTTGGAFTMPVSDLVARLQPTEEYLVENTEYSLSFTRYISENEGNTNTAITAQIKTAVSTGAPTASSTDVMCSSQTLATVSVACLDWTLSIAQDSTYPCDDNTISISLRSSVPLLGTCGTAEDAQARPKLTITGLSLISTSSNAVLPLGSGGSGSIFGTSGAATTGDWIQGSGSVVDKLEITLLADLVHDTDYDFSITIKNAPEHQDNTINIGIDKLQVCGATTFPQLLTIEMPYILSSSAVTQSSPYPCAHNTITVKVETTVPLMDDCSPTVTVQGLKGACTADSTTAAPLAVASAEFATPATSWSKSEGRVIVATAGDDTADPAIALYSRSFEIVLENPAKHQEAPELTMTVKFTKASYTDALKNTLYFGTGRSLASVDMDDTYTGKPTETSLSLTTTYAPYAMPTNYQMYPMYIMQLRLAAFAAQSSPFPCDANTISVWVQTNVPLLKSCSPTISVAGLSGTQTTETSMDVTLHAGDGTNIIGDGAGAYTGTWTGATTGRMVLDLTDAAGTAGTADQTLSAANGADVLLMTFVVKNPKLERSCVMPTVNIGLSSCGTSQSSGLVNADTADSDGTYEALLRVVVPTIRSTVTAAKAGTDTAQFAMANTESCPLRIRAAVATCIEVHQSTTYPCAENTVTITLNTNVPYGGADIAACAQITIGGLSLFQTEAAANLASVPITLTSSVESNAVAVFDTETSIKVTPDTTTVMTYDTNHVFVFTRFNKQTLSTTTDKTITMTSEFRCASPQSCTESCFGSLAYTQPACQLNTIVQRSAAPCASNIITVSLSSNVPLLATCGNAIANQQRPKLTVRGLIGLADEADALGVGAVQDSDTSDLSVTTTWAGPRLSATASLLTITLGADVDATAASGSFDQTITITATNSPVSAADSTSVDVSVDRIYTAVSWCEISGSIDILNPAFRAASYVQQSTPYPCAVNTLTVNVVTNVPLFATVCIPKISVTGLTGSCTDNDAGLTVTGGAFATIGDWTKSSGRLVVDVTGEDAEAAGTELTGTHSYVHTFTFELTNPAAYQSAPSVTLAGSFNQVSPSVFPVQQWSISTVGMSETMSGAPYYDFTSVSDYNTVPGTSAYAPYAMPTGFEKYPLYIMPLRLRAFAAQSSPFPCDDNTISVWVQTNVPLLQSCSPTISVAGLSGTQTTETSMDVTLHAGDGTNIIGDGAGAYTGTWTGATTGRMVLDLTTAAGTAGTADQTLFAANGAAVDESVDVLLMTFVVKNPNQDKDFVTPRVDLKLTDTCSKTQEAKTDSDGASEMVLADASTSGVYYSDTFATLGFEASLAFKVDRVCAVDDNTCLVPHYSGPRWYEARPLQVRRADFFTGYETNPYLQASTENPCAANTVSITLHSYVPIFKECGGQATKISLTGLDTFQVPFLSYSQAIPEASLCTCTSSNLSLVLCLPRPLLLSRALFSLSLARSLTPLLSLFLSFVSLFSLFLFSLAPRTGRRAAQLRTLS